MKWMRHLIAILLMLVTASPATAAGIPWADHARPFGFRFGNDIDTHQQTRKGRNGDLFGFFYIVFSGDTTADGFPVATHADCNAVPDCKVGWILNGKAGAGTFLYHVEGDHPVWLVNRSGIPQPGAFAHFHWLGSEHPVAGDPPQAGYFLQLFAVDTFCFIHEGGAAIGSGTCAEVGGVAVRPGLDIATHVNIVTSFPGDGGM